MFRILCRHKVSCFICYILAVVISLYSTGFYQYLFTLSYDKHYRHWGPSVPLTQLVHQIQEDSTPDILPINEFRHTYISRNVEKCQLDSASESIRLIFIVKSSIDHFYRREIIRQSWGFEQRFSDVNIRTVFLVGTRPDEPHLQVRIDKENRQFKDIIQANFIDNYYNNTHKTMMGLDWTFNFCKKVKYFFFVDDDYYVSTRNVLRFIRDPKNYPQYLDTYVVSAVNEYQENMWAGYVFRNSYPMRHIFSKWYVTLEEYPYSKYPPYVTAGAYIVSWRSLQSLYYASIYTKFYRFDDIFLGMCGKKANLVPFHHNEFLFTRKSYSIEKYKYTIASHGFGDPDEMHRIWEEQRSVGSA